MSNNFFFDFIHGIETNWQLVYLDMIHSYLYKFHKNMHAQNTVLIYLYCLHLNDLEYVIFYQF
jgi:hypothetical protein